LREEEKDIKVQKDMEETMMENVMESMYKKLFQVFNPVGN